MNLVIGNCLLFMWQFCVEGLAWNTGRGSEDVHWEAGSRSCHNWAASSANPASLVLHSIWPPSRVISAPCWGIPLHHKAATTHTWNQSAQDKNNKSCLKAGIGLDFLCLATLDFFWQIVKWVFANHNGPFNHTRARFRWLISVNDCNDQITYIKSFYAPRILQLSR